jgi:hypothetical protein
VELNESLLSKAAGWEAMKFAEPTWLRGKCLVRTGALRCLRGVVQTGSMSFRASMVIKSDIDIENLVHRVAKPASGERICPP